MAAPASPAGLCRRSASFGCSRESYPHPRRLRNASTRVRRDGGEARRGRGQRRGGGAERGAPIPGPRHAAPRLCRPRMSGVLPTEEDGVTSPSRLGGGRGRARSARHCDLISKLRWFTSIPIARFWQQPLGTMGSTGSRGVLRPCRALLAISTPGLGLQQRPRSSLER